jgi:hypothetical protein
MISSEFRRILASDVWRHPAIRCIVCDAGCDEVINALLAWRLFIRTVVSICPEKWWTLGRQKIGRLHHVSRWRRVINSSHSSNWYVKLSFYKAPHTELLSKRDSKWLVQSCWGKLTRSDMSDLSTPSLQSSDYHWLLTGSRQLPGGANDALYRFSSARPNHWSNARRVQNNFSSSARSLQSSPITHVRFACLPSALYARVGSCVIKAVHN